MTSRLLCGSASVQNSARLSPFAVADAALVVGAHLEVHIRCCWRCRKQMPLHRVSRDVALGVSAQCSGAGQAHAALPLRRCREPAGSETAAEATLLVTGIPRCLFVLALREERMLLANDALRQVETSVAELIQSSV